MAGTQRRDVVNALVTLFKTIDGTGSFKSNVFGNVINRVQFYDEVIDFPSISVTCDSETRQYLPGDFKWAFAEITIRIYTNSEQPQDDLDKVIYDIEVLLDNNNNLTIGTNNLVELIINSINDDGGALAPVAFGEISVTARYQVI